MVKVYLCPIRDKKRIELQSSLDDWFTVIHLLETKQREYLSKKILRQISDYESDKAIRVIVTLKEAEIILDVANLS